MSLHSRGGIARRLHRHLPRYRALPRAFGAVCMLVFSVSAVVTHLAQDGTACGF